VSNYARGTRREHDVRRLFEKRSYVCVRGAGSKGADLVCGKAGYPTLMIEVKANRNGGPYASFPPAEREETKRRAEAAGWDLVLVWWPPDRKGPRFIPSWGWPT
jgi:Holliday junction resolvase